MMSLSIQATWLRGDIRSKLSRISKAKFKSIELTEDDLIDAKEDGEDLKALLFEYGLRLSIFEISNAGGNIDMQLLAGGLYTAMTTTVAGLIVGIVGYITYNHLVVKTNKVVYQMEAISLAFFDLLNEPV